MKKSPTSLIPLFILSIMLISCANLTSISGTDQRKGTTEIGFNALVPAPLGQNETLYVEILDEITGVNLNPKRFEMKPTGESVYVLKMAFPSGSVIHYRYYKSGDNASVERDSFGNPVIYRVVLVNSGDELQDRVISWADDASAKYTGEISGYIYDAGSETPLGEIMVFINGMRAVTSFDGYYEFNNVPAGQFNLVAMHPDGKYQAFQQKADLADNSLTPASFGMKPSQNVTVTFNVSVPEGTPKNAVVRLLGNLFTTGNSHSVFPDGTSVLSSRSPQLNHQNGRRYSIQVELPSGYDLRYKYSLGDGLINAEHDQDGEFLTRQLIVPNRSIKIDDEIITWFSKGSQPVAFSIQSPVMDASDAVSIQFNPFTWMNPFPMWKVSETQWAYSLYSPLEYLRNAQFRFCQNDQCGIMDDSMTSGKESLGYSLSYGGEMLTAVNYQVEDWAWSERIEYPVEPSDFSQPNTIIIKGFALNDHYQMSWLPYTLPGLVEASAAGANWLVLSPGWVFHSHKEKSAQIDYIYNPSAADLLEIRNLASKTGMDFVLFPQPFYTELKDGYWAEADLTFGGWDQWFIDYERMLMSYADFAEANQISTLIIGGKGITPSFPNGKLPDGNPSNSPYNSAERWADLMEKIRARYQGQIGFALPSSLSLTDETLPFVNLSDFLYLQFDSPVYSGDTLPGLSELKSQVSQIFDQEIYKLYATLQKPVIVGVDYFAISGSGANCQDVGKSCRQVYEQSLKGGEVAPDLVEQADLYQAVMSAISQKSWISGFVSEGYNPVISNQDASNSVRGKPSMQVLSYYYLNLIR